MFDPSIQCADEDVLRSGIFPNVFEDFVSDRFGKKRLSILCCPDKVNPNTDVRHMMVGLKPISLFNLCPLAEASGNSFCFYNPRRGQILTFYHQFLHRIDIKLMLLFKDPTG